MPESTSLKSFIERSRRRASSRSSNDKDMPIHFTQFNVNSFCRSLHKVALSWIGHLIYCTENSSTLSWDNRKVCLFVITLHARTNSKFSFISVELSLCYKVCISFVMLYARTISKCSWLYYLLLHTYLHESSLVWLYWYVTDRWTWANHNRLFSTTSQCG